jgi:hypothetical protein
MGFLQEKAAIDPPNHIQRRRFPLGIAVCVAGFK